MGTSVGRKYEMVWDAFFLSKLFHFLWGFKSQGCDVLKHYCLGLLALDSPLAKCALRFTPIKVYLNLIKIHHADLLCIINRSENDFGLSLVSKTWASLCSYNISVTLSYKWVLCTWRCLQPVSNLWTRALRSVLCVWVLGSRSRAERVRTSIAWINVRIKTMFAHWQKRWAWNGDEAGGLPKEE